MRNIIMFTVLTIISISRWAVRGWQAHTKTGAGKSLSDGNLRCLKDIR